MKMSIKNSWVWIYIVVIVSLSFTIIPGWIPIARKEWYFLVLGAMGTFLLYDKYFSSKMFLCLVFYFIILYLNKMSGDRVYESIPIIVYEVLQYQVPSAICFYALIKRDNAFMQKVVLLVMAIVCIESVASFFVNQQAPNIIRELEALTRAEGDRSFAYNYYKLGLANYSFVHGLPIAIPPIICLLKENAIKRKWLLWAVLILLCVLIYISASITAILLMILMLALALLSNLNGLSKNMNKLIAVVILFSPILLSESNQIAVIDSLEKVVSDNTYFYGKLESFRYSIEYEGAVGDVEARVVRYNQSIDGFKENVLFGSNRKLGGHSSFLDRLGNLGIIGLVPLLSFLFFQVKQTMPYIPDRHKIFYLEGIFAAVLLFALKSVGLWGMLLMTFVILPFILAKPNE